MIVTKYANRYLVIHSDIYATVYSFLRGGWAQRSQAIQPMVAHVNSDLLLEKKSWRFLATTYSRIVMI